MFWKDSVSCVICVVLGHFVGPSVDRRWMCGCIYELDRMMRTVTDGVRRSFPVLSRPERFRSHTLSETHKDRRIKRRCLNQPLTQTLLTQNRVLSTEASDWMRVSKLNVHVRCAASDSMQTRGFYLCFSLNKDP